MPSDTPVERGQVVERLLSDEFIRRVCERYFGKTGWVESRIPLIREAIKESLHLVFEKSPEGAFVALGDPTKPPTIKSEQPNQEQQVGEGLRMAERLEERVLRTPELTPRQKALEDEFADEMPEWAQLSYLQSELERMREEIRQVIAEGKS